METRYDPLSGNMICMQKDNKETISYLWSYKNSLPIAEIKGASYNMVEEWLGKTEIFNISNSNCLTMEKAKSIQSTLAQHNAIATMYLHDPIWGVTTIIKPNGEHLHYQYDYLGRLNKIFDMDNNLVNKFIYNYSK